MSNSKKIGLFRRDLGWRIVEIRLKKGWNQSHLAVRMECSWRQIQYWESGRTPNAYNLYRLSQALGCKVDDFYHHAKLHTNHPGSIAKKIKRPI